MAWLSILDRFRPVGAPGPVAPAGVPSQDVAGPRAELAPVFAALHDDVARSAAVADEARAEAVAVVEAARRRAAAVLAQASADAHTDRVAAVEAALAAARDEGARHTGRARAEAARIRSTADVRAPAVVARAVDLVLERPGPPPAGASRDVGGAAAGVWAGTGPAGGPA